MSYNKEKTNTEEKEIINYYNDEYKKIGTISRQEGVKQNLLLEAVQLWIIHPETKQVLMQVRAKEKENDSNMIDVSCSRTCKRKRDANTSNVKRST